MSGFIQVLWRDMIASYDEQIKICVLKINQRFCSPPVISH